MAKRTGNPVGRPRVVIDLELVGKLALIQCTVKEIGAVIGIPPTTLAGRDDFRSAYENGLENGKASLRRTQYKLAEKSAAMAIFLGKNYLGQRDEPLVDQSTHYHVTLTDEQLIERARASGVELPPAVAARIRPAS